MDIPLKIRMPRSSDIILAPFILMAAVRLMDRIRGDGTARYARQEAGSQDVFIQSADGTRLHANISGEGVETLFMIHGWTCNETIFRFQKNYFNKKYRVVALDLRGHGQSGLPRDLDYHPDRLAEDLKSAVDYVEPDRFVIAGHSMGGFTAFKFYEHFASEYDGRLRGLAIIDSTGTDLVDGLMLGSLVRRIYPQPLSSLMVALGRNNLVSDFVKGLIKDSNLAYTVVRWGAFGRKPRGDDVEHVREMVLNTPMTTICLAAKACLDFRYDYFLPEVRVPTLLMVGQRDKLTSREVNQTTADLLPDSKLVVFPDAGHCTLLERRERFNDELGKFVEEVFAG